METAMVSSEICKKVYDYLVDYISEFRTVPTHQEIAEATGVSLGSVGNATNQLHNLGYIRKEHNRNKAIQILKSYP